MIVESARIVIEIDGERALATLLAGRSASQTSDHPGYSNRP